MVEPQLILGKDFDLCEALFSSSFVHGRTSIFLASHL